MQVVIQPSANCQLGCTYCGQVHRKTNLDSDLSEKVINRIVSNATRRAYKKVTVKWYGGEALMALTNITTMSERLIAACEENGIKYAAGIITNGMSLKPPVVRRLLAVRCTHFQITLDGVARTHDQLRPTKTGRPTFDVILNNIIAATGLEEFKKSGAVIAVRMNINRVSGEEIFSLIDLLASKGLQTAGVRLDFQPVVDWGDNGASSDSYGPSEYAGKEIEWTMYAMEKGFQMSGILPRRTYQPCMVVQPDGEVYDADGNVYPCYEFPYTPAYEDSKYKLGHLDTIDEQHNDKAVTRGWYEDILGEVSPCKRCSLFPVCGGGCPKKWLQGERACPPFKENIVDRLALSYVTKFASDPREDQSDFLHS